MSRGLRPRCRSAARVTRVVRRCLLAAAGFFLASCGTVQVSSDATASSPRARPQTNAEYERAQLIALGCATPYDGSRGPAAPVARRQRPDTTRIQRTVDTGPDVRRGVIPVSVQPAATATAPSSSMPTRPAGGEIRNVQKIGGSYIGPGGQTSTRIGGIMFNSDGTSGTLIGNTIFNR